MSDFRGSIRAWLNGFRYKMNKICLHAASENQLAGFHTEAFCISCRLSVNVRSDEPYFSNTIRVDHRGGFLQTRLAKKSSQLGLPKESLS